MSQHRLANDLYLAHMPASGAAFYVPTASGRLLGYGVTVPSAVTGWAPGAIFIDTDSNAVYMNTGTAASCTFTALLPLTGGTMTGTLVSAGVRQKYTIVESATNVTITAAMLNGFVEVTGTTASNLNLPAVSAAPAGTWITFIKNGASGALTIEPDASETVHGAANNNTMDADNDTITIVSSGTEWFITAKNVA